VGDSRWRFEDEEDLNGELKTYVSSCQLRERMIKAVRIPQFELVLGVSCEECFCEGKILCVIFGVCDLMRLL
jgi:hypothetical protein